MTQEIVPGVPHLIAPYQWLDPLRGKVPEDMLCDGSQRKIDGSRTWLMSATFGPQSADSPYKDWMNHDLRAKKLFYQYTKEERIHCLAFGMDVFETLTELDSESLNKLALELYPHPNNRTLGVFHGRPSGYVQGCRGPLCTHANTEYQRNQRGTTPADLVSYSTSLAWNKIAESHEQYRNYIKSNRRWRISRFPKRDYSAEAQLWRAVTYTDTVLMDATDEEALILG